jgi:hypothetical protein
MSIIKLCYNYVIKLKRIDYVKDKSIVSTSCNLIIIF